VRTALTLALTLASGGAVAQTPAPNVLTLHPLSLITGYVDLEVERALGRMVSVYVAPGAIFATRRGTDGNTSPAVFGWSVDVGARVFPFRRAPSGFFVDLSAGYYSSWFEGAVRERGDGLRGVVGVGYTLVLWRHLVLSTGLGFQTRAQGPGFDRLGVSFGPSLRVALGAAF
jgi:hypothetical protein